MRRYQKALKSELRDKADSAWRYFAWGFPCPFESHEEALACWEVVRGETMARHKPIGTVDEHGCVQYHPFGWWEFDCPAAPFRVETPDGIDSSDWFRHKQYQALVEWEMLPPTARDEGMESIMRSVAYYKEKYDAGRDKLTSPMTTVPERLDALWEEIKSKIAAYKRLGLLEDNERQSKYNRTDGISTARA